MVQIIAFRMGFNLSLCMTQVHIIWKSKGCENNLEIQAFCGRSLNNKLCMKLERNKVEWVRM